jgi:hypothetical protein
LIINFARRLLVTRTLRRFVWLCVLYYC